MVAAETRDDLQCLGSHHLTNYRLVYMSDIFLPGDQSAVVLEAPYLSFESTPQYGHRVSLLAQVEMYSQCIYQ
jgi:hypothetical protein